ncbi:CHM2A protein, partial [Fregetta grallaria]|nr:CHM2A protein [Fregetta grallaria]
MMEFEKQAEIMDMKEELMNDAIDDAMGDEDDEEERWGTRRGTGMWSSGEGRAPEAAGGVADADADLEERLKNLRRD